MSMAKAEGGASFNTATAPSIASSSALAFMAIPQFWPGIFNRAIAHKQNAPIAYIRDGQLFIGKEYDPSVNNYNLQQNYKDISQPSSYTRLGDGGFGDNTSLAYNLSAAIRKAYSGENLHLNGNSLSDQKEKQLIHYTRPEDGFDKFEATLFHNNTEALSDLTTVNDQKLPNDLLSLFAADTYARASNQSELGYTRSSWLENPNNLLKNTQMEVPLISSAIWQISPQIFSTDSLTGMTIKKNGSVTITTGLNDPHWEFKSIPKAGSQGVHLQFWRIPVRTVENEVYGIKEGVGGYLNLFLSLNPESNAMPYENAIHKEYAENYDVWRQAMSSFNDKYNTNFLQVEHGSF